MAGKKPMLPLADERPQGMQTIALPGPAGDIAGTVETDGNTIYKAYCHFRGTKDLGSYQDYDSAVMAIKREYNRQVADWNWYAQYGL